MRRRFPILTVLASVCLGAMVTTLVAVACSIRSTALLTRTEYWSGAPGELTGLIPSQWCDPDDPSRFSYSLDVYRGPGIEVLSAKVSDSLARVTPAQDRALYVRRAGWPFFAFQCGATQEAASAEVTSHAFAVPKTWPQVKDPSGRTGPALLPLCPRPVDFTLNTLTCAATILLCLKALKESRRVIRRLCSRCTECGYDRQGLASTEHPCPECGTPSPTVFFTLSKWERRQSALARWTFTLTLAILVAAFAGSLFWEARWFHPGPGRLALIQLRRAAVFVSYGPNAPSSYLRRDQVPSLEFVRLDARGVLRPIWAPMHFAMRPDTYFSVPLYIPLLVLALPTAATWRRELRRRRSAGQLPRPTPS